MAQHLSFGVEAKITEALILLVGEMAEWLKALVC